MKGSRLSRAVAGAAIAAALAGLSPAAFAQAPAADNQAQRLEPIVVTATRIEQRVSEQAADVTVVPRDVIELKSPVVAGDVLQGIPGVDAQQSGSPGNLQNVKIRGGKGTHTLVMIDGFAVNSPAGGEFDISSLPVGGFEQIEIVRGAQSALYGSNAMGGVVNFIPRKPDRARAAAAGLSGGSFDTLNWNAYGQGRGSAGDIHVGAGGVESSGSLRNDDLSLVSFIGVGNAALGTFSRLHMIVLTTDEQKGIPVDDRGFDPLAHKARRDFLGGARWEIALSRAAALTLSGAEFDEHLHIEEPPDPSFVSSSDFLVKTRKTTARAELRYSFPKLSTTFVGVEYLKDRAQNDVISRFPPFPDFESRTSAATYNRSAFLQEELRFGKGDGLSLGIRGDRNSEAGTKWNPKVAGFHAFGSTGITARAAYGRGFRVPTIVEKFDPNNGNPDLSSESVDSYEAGLDWRPPRGRADVSATWFYQDFSDLIQTGTTIPPGRLFPELENVATAFSRGVEAAGTWWFHPAVGAAVSYTYSDTWDTTNRRRILGIPKQRGTASLLLSPAPGWDGRIEWHVESDQLDFAPDGFVPGRRPGYARLDAFARYKWAAAGALVREVALSGKVQNVLNRHYEERLGVPSPGVNFLVGAEVGI